MQFMRRSMHPGWLSNSYVVADSAGGHAVVVDTGGPTEPIVAYIQDQQLTVTHVLCTHHHHDHVANNDTYRRNFGAPVCGHASERHLFGELDIEIEHGEQIESGQLRIRALHIPGHTVGQLAFDVQNEHDASRCVFTGDTLFRGSVGGTRGPGHATFDDIRRSIMDVLMQLPHELTVYPGHTDQTTIGDEWQRNPFIRVWRGLDQPGNGRCTAFGEPATLLLDATDYDGGSKCWVRFDDGDTLDIVPGSRVRVIR